MCVLQNGCAGAPPAGTEGCTCVLGTAPAERLWEQYRAFYRLGWQAPWQRHALLLSNTWGDRNRDARVCETFVLQEIDRAAALGLDTVQIDDGWQKGTTVNSARPLGGWRIGLGSDVAGGHTLDLFAVMAAAVQVSKLRWRYVDQSEAPLTMTEALYLATVGGGEFWQDFGEQVGLFEPGYAFDALVLDDSHLRSLRSFTPAERLERYAYLGKGALSAKFAQGKKLF